MTEGAIVLLSGGLDSMVCAALAREAGFEVTALTVDYGQRHRIELNAARAVAAQLADRHSTFLFNQETLEKELLINCKNAPHLNK